jgi:diacylglycerol kinase
LLRTALKKRCFEALKKSVFSTAGAKVILLSPICKPDFVQNFAPLIFASINLINPINLYQPAMSINAFRHAFRGLADMLRTQRNARFHVAATAAVVAAGFWLDISRLEWVAVVLCMALVLALEAANTALEYLTDLVSPEYHPLAGKAKDAAAGAVLVAALGAAAVGGLVFLPKLVG